MGGQLSNAVRLGEGHICIDDHAKDVGSLLCGLEGTGHAKHPDEEFGQIIQGSVIIASE